MFFYLPPKELPPCATVTQAQETISNSKKIQLESAHKFQQIVLESQSTILESKERSASSSKIYLRDNIINQKENK